MKIAGTLTIEDWDNLKVNLNPSTNENWGLAFHFFEERIRTRYLNPIKSILNMDLKTGEGFAVVNLQCSLIETIESFINGWIYNSEKDKEKGIINNKWYNRTISKENLVLIEKQNDDKSLKNEDIFVSFFNKRQPFESLVFEREDFYKSVRCGLLHETQTKNSWKIHAKSIDQIIYEKIIYRTNLQNAIEDVIKNYKKAIVKGDKFDEILAKIELRENFKAKFQHICDISKTT